jgi:hypothetical protein
MSKEQRHGSWERRSASIFSRVTAREKAAIVRGAEQHNQSEAAWIRETLTARLRRERLLAKDHTSTR